MPERCNPMNGHAGPCDASDCILGDGPDMHGVNRRDAEDCDRCLQVNTHPCGFHQGFEHGYAAAVRLMREALDDPETIAAAIHRRDSGRAKTPGSSAQNGSDRAGGPS